MHKRSRIFWFIYILFILFLSFSVLKNVFSHLSSSGQFSFPLVLLNLLQRLSGSVVLFLLFIQILLGAYRPKLSKLFGSWVMNLHIWQGRIIYLLVLVHTFSFLLFNFISKKGFNPFYIFVDFCVLCQTRVELFYSFGRFGFWVLTITVMAAILRSWNWWRQNWRYFHFLNYPLFFLIGLHTFFIGPDFSLKFGYLGKLNLILMFIVLIVVLEKIFSWFKRSLKK